MEFSTEKCSMPIRKSKKRETTERIKQSNQENIRTLLEKENYLYLGILEADTIKQAGIKEKIRKEYIRRTSKLLEINFSYRNLIQEINNGKTSLYDTQDYSYNVKRSNSENGPRTKKLMTMHKAFVVLCSRYLIVASVPSLSYAFPANWFINSFCACVACERFTSFDSCGGLLDQVACVLTIQRQENLLLTINNYLLKLNGVTIYIYTYIYIYYVTFYCIW